MVLAMEAYIFVNCQPLRVWQIVEEALKIKGMKRAHAVTGQFKCAGADGIQPAVSPITLYQIVIIAELG